ncbi:uncharacterized protein K452DRAFT_300605 [Aplosporella prunicola CBS 121167]|uniref:Uncharacterized protein n=1 Tax=Aplosporella prunicola CBS 121167 TaxID=1176127 RepID=A0A6A6B4R3_9PEZI|nr:uncharacterized protein K452DRAFT_300605 [Aplosporella prunicola CBS 121167]KAF2139030.1 hypothetical protein K452DRAFT_300605 [Aplosporella prunicola CBS 121167]
MPHLNTHRGLNALREAASDNSQKHNDDDHVHLLALALRNLKSLKSIQLYMNPKVDLRKPVGATYAAKVKDKATSNTEKPWSNRTRGQLGPENVTFADSIRIYKTNAEVNMFNDLSLQTMDKPCVYFRDNSRSPAACISSVPTYKQSVCTISNERVFFSDLSITNFLKWH